MVDGPAEAAPRLAVVHLGDERRALHLVGVRRKLDRDGFGGAGRLLAVQVLDGVLRLRPLVEADEGHAAGQACGRTAGPGVRPQHPDNGRG